MSSAYINENLQASGFGFKKADPQKKNEEAEVLFVPDWYIPKCEGISLASAVVFGLAALLFLLALWIMTHRWIRALLPLALFSFDSLLMFISSVRMAYAVQSDLVSCFHHSEIESYIRLELSFYIITVWVAALEFALFLCTLDALRITRRSKILVLCVSLAYSVYLMWNSRYNPLSGWADLDNMDFSMISAVPREHFSAAKVTFVLVICRHILVLASGGSLSNVRLPCDLVWRNRATGDYLTDVEKVEHEQKIIARFYPIRTAAASSARTPAVSSSSH